MEDYPITKMLCFRLKNTYEESEHSGEKEQNTLLQLLDRRD